MENIAFLGLGAMGQGMAARLLDAGHVVNVYNRTALRADALVARGARRCESPRAACEGVTVVMAMVADDAASRAVWTGEQGVFAASLPPGALLIECSTLSHDWVQELAAMAGQRGLRYIDSPVTGLPDAAAAGTLTLLVGAAAGDLAAATEWLDVIGERVLHFGAPGAGTAYKLIVNLLGAVQIASAAEAMAIAERAGLEPGLVAEAIAGGQAASPQVVRNCRRMVAGDHDQNVVFTPTLRLKDVDYALRLAGQCGIGSPFGVLAQDAFAQACELGYAQRNESVIIEVARRAAHAGAHSPAPAAPRRRP